MNTQNVINACIQSGIRQVILTGSCSVYGEEHHPQPKDEESGWNSHYPYFLDRVFPCGMNYYRDTKNLGQQAAIRIARAYGLNLTVIDPVWVYGERERITGFYEYLKSVSEGMSVMPGSSRNSFHVIYAGDLARLYVLALQKNLPGVEKIIAGNPRPQNMRHIYAEFCRAAGVKPPALLPRWIFYPAGFLLELLATLTGSKKPPLLTRGRVNMFYDSIAYNPEKARRLLGFTASTPLEEGVRRTVDWYRKNGWLKEKP